MDGVAVVPRVVPEAGGAGLPHPENPIEDGNWFEDF